MKVILIFAILISKLTLSQSIILDVKYFDSVNNLQLNYVSHQKRMFKALSNDKIDLFIQKDLNKINFDDSLILTGGIDTLLVLSKVQESLYLGDLFLNKIVTGNQVSVFKKGKYFYSFLQGSFKSLDSTMIKKYVDSGVKRHVLMSRFNDNKKLNKKVEYGLLVYDYTAQLYRSYYFFRPKKKCGKMTYKMSTKEYVFGTEIELIDPFFKRNISKRVEIDLTASFVMSLFQGNIGAKISILGE